MQTPDLLHNLLSPAILFFMLGLVAVLIRSDLELPAAISRFLSLYLLMAIGFKGGQELAHSGFTMAVWTPLLLAVGMALLVPVYTFFILKKKLDIKNAGAIAATYGSVSAVTFVTATAYLRDLGIPFGGHMVAAMALMESPAIVVGVMLIRLFDKGTDGKNLDVRGSLGPVIREAFTNGSVVMILGSLVIGLVSRESAAEALNPFLSDIFKGVLALFLLDMGLLAGRRIVAMKEAGAFLVGFSIAIPLLNAVLAIGLAHFFSLETGDALLLTVLAASASYIAVPAAMRLVVPQANPGLYVPMSLAVTFPFNIIIGIPLYLSLLQL
jgi:uncharacterized protein